MSKKLPCKLLLKDWLNNQAQPNKKRFFLKGKAKGGEPIPEEDIDEAADLLPQGIPISGDFWESPTLEELARCQNISPMTDVSALFGPWPGENDDEFEADIDKLRHLHKAELGKISIDAII